MFMILLQIEPHNKFHAFFMYFWSVNPMFVQTSSCKKNLWIFNCPVLLLQSYTKIH